MHFEMTFAYGLSHDITLDTVGKTGGFYHSRVKAKPLVERTCPKRCILMRQTTLNSQQHQGSKENTMGLTNQANKA